MLYCPYCGTGVNIDEQYCIKCGDKLPSDINNRHKTNKQFNLFWYIPILITILFVIASVSYHFILENKNIKAERLYKQGETSVQKEDYDKAERFFRQALELKSNFYEADVFLDFLEKAVHIENVLDNASVQNERVSFQEALSLVDEAEYSLKDFHGLAVNQLINQIHSLRDTIKVEQLKTQLDNQPSIHELKNLLWDSEAIKSNTTKEMADNIREQIIAYTFSKASERLNQKQFSDAQILVEDGLKYAAHSERLLSLQTTISKEKTAFETAEQERIEQAITTAAEENELNTHDAVTLQSAKIRRDGQDKLVVSGEVSSVATIPISSVLVEYFLLNEKGNKLLSNKVFVYPDKLYPEEVGKFEFTHYDISKKQNNLEIEVNKITWYTD